MSLNNMFYFKPLESTDIDLLYSWIKQPHVAQWWAEDAALDQASFETKFQSKLKHNWQWCFIAFYQGHPIGYIHYYDAEAASQHKPGWWKDQQAGAYGIDQFIGEVEYVGKGYGTIMIKEFVAMIFEKTDAQKIILDVDPKNLRAIRCYQKSGFEEVGLINTPDGKALLMELTSQKCYKS